MIIILIRRFFLLFVILFLIVFFFFPKKKDHQIDYNKDSFLEFKFDSIPSYSNYTGTYTGYYADKKIRYTGYYSNGLKEGKFTTYYPSGVIEIIQNFVNDTLEGEARWYTIEKVPTEVVKYYFNKGICFEQIVYDTLTQDTISHYKDHIAYLYENCKLKKIYNSKDTNNRRTLQIRNDTIILNKYPTEPLGFLSGKDSSEIYKYFPNWEKMPRVVIDDEKRYKKKENIFYKVKKILLILFQYE